MNSIACWLNGLLSLDQSINGAIAENPQYGYVVERQVGVCGGSNEGIAAGESIHRLNPPEDSKYGINPEDAMSFVKEASKYDR